MTDPSAAQVHDQLLDSIKTRVQRDGEARFGAHLTVAEVYELVSDLGLDPREVIVSGTSNFAMRIAVTK